MANVVMRFSRPPTRTMETGANASLKKAQKVAKIQQAHEEATQLGDADPHDELPDHRYDRYARYADWSVRYCDGYDQVILRQWVKVVALTLLPCQSVFLRLLINTAFGIWNVLVSPWYLYNYIHEQGGQVDLRPRRGWLFYRSDIRSKPHGRGLIFADPFKILSLWVK